MIRSSELPFLPGYSFNYNVGQTRFHKSQHLELIGKEVPYLSEKSLPGIGGVPLPNTEINRFPSIYSRGEVTELPTWLIYDKEILCFDCFYMENVAEGGIYKNYIIHNCKLYYFLEDGTIQVFEKPTDNSGLSQGCIIRRQKIKLPTAGNSPNFYDIIDFNIGKQIDLFGKVFKITDCDLFTRRFLNRLGIAVPEPLKTPEDPYLQIRKLQDCRRKIIKKKVMKDLLQMDNRILSFDGYWDDTKNQHGVLHKLKIRFYLADDTIEIKDVTDPENQYIIVKRGKFPKDMEMGIPELGAAEPLTVLNVLGPVEKTRRLVDPLNSNYDEKEYYTDRDLTIGATLGSYGRRFVITDMDKFTKEYYRQKFGIDDLNPIETPKTREELAMEKAQSVRPKTPPYNGFGDYEDSMKSVKFLNPSEKVNLWKIDPEKDPLGYDSKILRFGAQLIENGVPVKDRKFIVRYYMMDDTISVYEKPVANSGREGGNLIKRRKIPVYGQNIFKSAPPETVSLEEFYIGNIVNLDNFNFQLTETDEYTMRYMEIHPNEFPRSNVRYILEKLRHAVKGDYKKWASQFVKEVGTFPYHVYRNAVKEALGDKISEHEILALARHYRAVAEERDWGREAIRKTVHDELRRLLYDDFQRLRESFQHFDPTKSGAVSHSEAYHILRGAKIPINSDLLMIILEKFSYCESEEDTPKIRYDELIDFFNYKKYQHPSGYKTDYGVGFAVSKFLTVDDEMSGFKVDVIKLIDDLQLEDDLKKESL